MTPDFEEKQSGFSGILLWISAGTVLFMFLGLHAFWGVEGRWAETAREMLLTGEYFRTVFNFKALPYQPLLSYWQQIPFIHLLGVEEFAVRIPGVLTALAGLAGTFILARKIFDRTTAILSSWFLLSTYGFLFWSRTVSAEITGMTLAVLSVAWFFQAEKKNAWIRFPVFYLLLLTGASAKGFQFVFIPLLFLLPHLFSEKKWLRCINAAHVISLLMGFLLFLLPFFLAELEDCGSFLASFKNFLKPEVLCKIFSFCGGRTAFFSCLSNLPRLLLPWTPFFILALIAAVKDRKSLDRRYFDFFTGILLLIIFFTVNPPQRWYFILPLVPFCCIFTASMLCREDVDPLFGYLTVFMRWVVVLTASLAFAAPVMLPVFQMMFKQLPPVMIVLALPLAGLTALIVCIMDNEPGNKIEHLAGIRHSLVSTVLGAAILSATVFCVIRPGMTVYRTGKPFIKSIAPLLSNVPPANIVFYGTDDIAEFQFYLNRKHPVTLLENGEMKSFLKRIPGEKVAVFCYVKSASYASFIKESTAAGIAPAVLKPVRLEPGRGNKKWALFLFEVPSVQKSAGEKKVQQNTLNIK